MEVSEEVTTSLDSLILNELILIANRVLSLEDHVLSLEGLLEILQLVSLDPLTGLANSRRFDDVMRAEIERARRTAQSFALILFDLDNLKTINDRYGHLAGSRAICRMADIMRNGCRVIDTVARFGGDEFALVLPDTGEDGARHVAQRITERMTSDSEQPPISAAFGISLFPKHGKAHEEIFRAADEALYAMKGCRGNKTKSHYHEGCQH